VTDYPAAPAGASKIKYNHQEPYSIGGRNSTTRSDTQPKSDSAQHNRITELWNHRVYPNRIKWFRRVIKTSQTPKLRARSGGETGQPDRCVYASVSQERRNLPELGRATSGLPGSYILCAATILERNRKENHVILSPSRTVLDRRPEQHNAIGYPT